MTGTLYGVGVGPGDPDLITLKALKILRTTPVVAYLAADAAESLARAIAAPHLPGGQAEVVIRVPMRTDPTPGQAVYDRAAEELAAHLEAGRDVAVLCEGDPLLYGSFQYLLNRLAGRAEVRVVPGVTSLTAASAAALAPLASRNDALAVLPAPLDAGVLRDRLRAADAAVIVKLGRHLPKVRAVLDELGLLHRAVYVERVSMDGQRILPLAQVDGPAPYFSMILVPR
ncbi:precorrin-2 C(20)-methyltransferase [Azospirillum sp.]|uniref:precorrin-2 C(20)-methyltransferase n=1 Tax=Azospirillum sp. TaxID=34012 RepID=UPI002D22AFFA|nr:precorrin-2 C(20)-methyltransferase [Azospirillum sp.]HYD69960.1 precorrin-2 C(20)-methyltransferase [Azospirillum sp.]